jgi:methylmalonyl-CoA mutase cobalamin-binding subunit
MAVRRNESGSIDTDAVAAAAAAAAAVVVVSGFGGGGRLSVAGVGDWLSKAYSTRLTAHPALAVRERPYSVMTL